jgi:ferritin-like metal-binding protein YciE
MDASADVLADTIRSKRVGIDNDLELLRVRLNQADPRRRLDPKRVSAWALPLVAGAAALRLWTKRRRSVDSLEGLLVYGLDDMYRAERQLVPALEHMTRAASNRDLKQAFDHHRRESEAHIDRLRRVYRSVRARPSKGVSASVRVILAESARGLKQRMKPDVRDAWLIAAAQRIEHVEIATYGTIRTCAETLGYTYASQLLQQTLEEERAADEKLTHLAERLPPERR